MRTIEEIEDDIFAIRALVQDAIRERDNEEIEALYEVQEALKEELWDAESATA
jgi:hypothetical protein